MKLIQSKKIHLPTIYLLETDEDLLKIPLGVPFIRGNIYEYDDIVMLLEFEILLKSVEKTGLPFKWEKILRENGYDFPFLKAKAESTKILIGQELYDDRRDDSELGIPSKEKSIEKYIRDISYQVDIEYLKELRMIPSWFGSIEENIKENILNTISYNPFLYNKKTELITGGVTLSSPIKNLIIIDISGSIPKSISSAILLLAKTMAINFYADLLITGSKSTIYDYNYVSGLDIDLIYSENGTDNDQVYFKTLVSEYRKYNTVIVFGDNHSPSMNWSNIYNRRTKTIPIEKGKEICKWDIEKIISFHTTSKNTLAGYADWFNTDNVEYIENWVTYLD